MNSEDTVRPAKQDMIITYPTLWQMKAGLPLYLNRDNYNKGYLNYQKLITPYFLTYSHYASVAEMLGQLKWEAKS